MSEVSEAAVSKPLFVEFHALVSHVPSNLNRDDLGTPKTSIFGGHRRLRISSQCLKRTWRTSSFFRGPVGEEDLGIRTQQLTELVLAELTKAGQTPEVAEGLVQLLASIGRKDKAKPGKADAPEDDEEDQADAGGSDVPAETAKAPELKTAHLLYLSRREIAEVTEFAKKKAKDLEKVFKAGKKGKKEVDGDALKKLREGLKDHLAVTCKRNAVDVAMFGRFITSDEFHSVNATVQVAHAIGTQKVEIEVDFFTAVDDLATNGASGLLGDAEMASSVFYKYAVCDLVSLRKTLLIGGEDRALAAKGLAALAHAVARAVPIGKKNSTAANNPAEYLEIIVRRDAPVSLANAFLKPVIPQPNSDVMDCSIAALRDHSDRFTKAYGEGKIEKRFVISMRDLEGVATQSLPDALKALEALLARIDA
jgi:CRISPR system Cascade subunit CasC